MKLRCLFRLCHMAPVGNIGKGFVVLQCPECDRKSLLGSHGPVAWDEHFERLHQAYKDGPPQLDGQEKITETTALKKQIAELEYQQEADTSTIGILADVVDVLWEDDSRCENHGYGDVVGKAKSLVDELKEIKEDVRGIY